MDTRQPNYGGIGNVNHTLKLKVIFFEGLLKDPKLVLKMYALVDNPPGNAEPREKIERLERVLQMEIDAKRIPHESGVGFAIMSGGVINVSEWMAKEPAVLRNQVYIQSYNTNPLTATPADVAKIGAFCVHELQVVGFERNAWIDYLNSEKSTRDKERYFATFL